MQLPQGQQIHRVLTFERPLKAWWDIPSQEQNVPSSQCRPDSGWSGYP